MQDHQDQPNLLTVVVGILGTGLTFLLAAVGVLSVNYGIAIASIIGAIICFTSANQLHNLAKMQFRSPFWFSERPQRNYLEAFKLIFYASVGAWLFFSFVFGSLFYIHDLQEKISLMQTGRHLTESQKAKMQLALRLSPSERYSFQINSSANCDECEQFAEELRDFFNAISGWETSGGPLVFAGQPRRHGLSLISGPDEKESIPIDKIYKAFGDAGISLSSGAEKIQKGTFVLVVGRISR